MESFLRSTTSACLRGLMVADERPQFADGGLGQINRRPSITSNSSSLRSRDESQERKWRGRFGIAATLHGERDLIRWTGFLVSEVADLRKHQQMPNTEKSLSAT